MKAAAIVAALVAFCAAPGAAAAKAAEEGVAAALQRQQPASGDSVGVAQTTAAPLLLTLLKDLRSEAEASLALEGSVAKWCQDARGQVDGMENVLRRQIDEANNEVRQVTLDSKRLSSEASLVNSTTNEKQEQLKDSTLAVKDASDQYLSEKKQLESMLEAANHAIQLLDAKASGGEERPAGSDHSINEELINNLDKLQRMADLSGSPYAGQGDQQSNGFEKMRSYQLKSTLVRLRDSLRSGLSAAGQEEQEVTQKHWIFADHLNSSVMEIQSQIAAIKMQVAQRKRERIHLEARIGDLTALLSATAQSRQATEATCAEEDKQKAEIAGHIKGESFIVKSMLKQTSPTDVGARRGAALSFLQVREKSSSSARALQVAMEELESMAKRFPQEASWYNDGASKLAQVQALSAPAIGAESPEQQQHSKENNALQNIRKFVAASGGVPIKARGARHDARSTENSGDEQHLSADEVGGLYSSLLGRVRLKEQVISDQRGRCAAILRDAAVDKAALVRSWKRVDAKRRIAKSMMSDCEQNEAYSRSQGKLLKDIMQRLGDLSKEAGILRTRARGTLRSHAEELMALSTDLGQQPSADEQHTARMVRDLAQKVDTHQKGLLRQHARLMERKTAVDLADKRLLKLLLADADHSRRRLAHLKAEEQLLAGVAFAKASDRELGAAFFEQAATFCSAEGLTALETKDRELRREEQVLQSSESAGRSPMAASVQEVAATGSQTD